MNLDPAYAIRRLGRDDETVLPALLDVFGAAFEDPATYGDARPDAGYLTRFLDRPHIVTLVAERDGAVVGGLVAYELMKFERARSEIYIYDLAVAHDHRRRGVATSLIRTLQTIAADRGAWVIFVQADPGDDPAIALYESLGIREDVLHFDVPVAPRPAVRP